MNKTELNNKLAELYGLQPFTYFNFMQPFPPSPPLKPLQVLLIDDWNVLMDLAVNNRVNIILNEGIVMCTNDRKIVDSIEFMSEHDTPQTATRCAIAMALIKLAEGK